MSENQFDPVREANEDDIAEQRQGLDGSGTVDPQTVSPDEANPADALEQGAEIDES